MAPNTKWMAALAGFYLMVSSGGSLNTYSLYSEYIKTSLGYNQEAVNTISFFKELGTAAGILAGLLYNISGAWLLLIVGALLNLFGYLMVWLSLTQRIADPQVWQLCLYICIVGASVAFTSTAILVVCANNFPKNQSVMLSLLDSTQGLSGGTFTLLFQAWFTTSSTSSFLLLLGFFPSALPVLLIFLLRQGPNSHNEMDTRILNKLLLVALVLAGYLMFAILLQHKENLGSNVLKALFGVMAVILLLPIPIVVYYDSRSICMPEAQPADNADEIHVPLLPLSASRKGPKHGDDYSVVEAIKSIDMWLIFVSTTCGIGGALTVYNNLGQIGIALGYSTRQTNTFVALLSIWDFLGGIACGLLSDVLLKSKCVPRPLFLALVLGILGLGNFILGLAIPGALFMGSILVGLSIGAQWAVLFTIIAEIFGLKNFGTLQNITYIAKALGTYFLSVQLAGILYDREVDHALQCIGSHCYRTTFFVMTAVCSVGCIASTYLTIRTQNFYRDVIRRRLLNPESDDNVF